MPDSMENQLLDSLVGVMEQIGTGPLTWLTMPVVEEGAVQDAIKPVDLQPRIFVQHVSSVPTPDQFGTKIHRYRATFALWIASKSQRDTNALRADIVRACYASENEFIRLYGQPMWPGEFTRRQDLAPSGLDMAVQNVFIDYEDPHDGTEIGMISPQMFADMFEAEVERRHTERFTATPDISNSWTGQMGVSGNPAGASRVCRASISFLRTGVGPNRIAEICTDEGFVGPPAGNGDLWGAPGDEVLTGFWNREHNLTCHMAELTSDPPVNPSDTMYSAFQLASLMTFPQDWIDDPPIGPVSNQQVVQLRARKSDGRWELLQVNPFWGGDYSRLHPLVGVPPFPAGSPYGFKLKIRFKVGEYLKAWVSRKGEAPILGLSLGPSDMILTTEGQNWLNQGLGCYVTSGSLAGARNAIIFSDFKDETFNYELP